MFGRESPVVVRISRHQMMSVTSPKVHTIAAPVPLSGCARWWPWISISASKKGVRTLVPMRCLWGPSGCVTIAMQAGSSSGRVVSTAMEPEPSAKGNSIVWYAACWSRSSSSACAMAERKSTSQSVGASAWYASPRSMLRRNASWLCRMVSSEMVR